MVNNTIAFVGIDNFDFILYLSSILSKLDKKVLIVDHSETKSVIQSIPQPMELNYESEIITYRQVDFTSMITTKEMLYGYEDVFIVYGFMEPSPDIELCNRILLVTDMYRYHQEKICSLVSKYSKEKEQELIIRDYIESKITPELISDRFQSPENTTIIFRDDNDYKNSLMCHFNRVFSFQSISRQLKQYLIDEILKLHPEISKNQLMTAYRRARKGE